MFRFRELIEKHFEELAILITREHGKTLAESRAELNRALRWSSSRAAYQA